MHSLLPNALTSMDSDFCLVLPTMTVGGASVTEDGVAAVEAEAEKDADGVAVSIQRGEGSLLKGMGER